MDNAFFIHDPDGMTFFSRKNKHGKGDPDNLVFDPVIVANFETAPAEFPVPLDAAEQFMDGDQFYASQEFFPAALLLFILGRCGVPPVRCISRN